MKTFNQRMTGLLFILMALLVISCEREGPMGAEGPQGPDGPPGEDGSGGDSNITTFVTPPSASLQWQGIDGWDGYGVYELKNYGFGIPEEYKKFIEEGLAVVYIGGPENDWYKLPWTWGEKKDHIYDCYFEGTEVVIYAKIKDDPNGADNDPVSVNKVKVVIAPASKVYTLSLTN
ncbi:MAG: hypothetical protein J7621_17370 [Niastella sp.]|nr:hypothetical protein [Niastella sp.]